MRHTPDDCRLQAEDHQSLQPGKPGKHGPCFRGLGLEYDTYKLLISKSIKELSLIVSPILATDRLAHPEAGPATKRGTSLAVVSERGESSDRCLTRMIIIAVLIGYTVMQLVSCIGRYIEQGTPIFE